MKVESAD